MASSAVGKTAARSSGWRSWLHRLLPLMIGGGLLALILSRTDLAGLTHILTRVQWQWYVLAQLMVAFSLLIITWRWRFDLGLLKLRYRFGELFLIDNAGALAGAATPGRMGDLARLIYFRQDKDVLVRVGLSILVERFLDLVFLVWLGTGLMLSFPLPAELRKFLLHLILAAHLCRSGSRWLCLVFPGQELALRQNSPTRPQLPEGRLFRACQGSQGRAELLCHLVVCLSDDFDFVELGMQHSGSGVFRPGPGVKRKFPGNCGLFLPEHLVYVNSHVCSRYRHQGTGHGVFVRLPRVAIGTGRGLFFFTSRIPSDSLISGISGTTH